MNKSHFWLPQFVLVLCLAANCSPSFSVSSTEEVSYERNLVQNGGFESAANGAPQSWSINGVARGIVEVSGAAHISGERSLEIRPNEKNTSGPERPGVVQTISAKDLNGKTLQISAWLSGKDKAVAVAILAGIKQNGIEVTRVLLNSAGPEFKQMQAKLKLPANNPSDLLILILVAEGTSGTAYFDDVSVQVFSDRVSQSPAVDQTAPRQALESLQAKINVTASKQIRKIPKTLFGTNVEWTYDASGIWDAGANKLNSEMTRLSRELGISLVRFPAGGLADYYDWRNGIGPQSERPVTLHLPGSNEKSRHTFGTDEALQFVSEISGELLLTVNFGTGTAAQAAEWVSYTNDRKDPFLFPKVRFWEVGNEIYMKGDQPSSQQISVSPEKYAERFLEYAEAMRQADPAIKIGAIGGEEFGRFKFISYPHWNQTVLSQAGSHIDFLAVHNGYAPVITEKNPPDPHEVYRAMLAAPVLIGQNLALLDQQISQYAKDPDGRIRIAVTEWGPIFQTIPGQPYLDHVKTLGSALYAASTIKAFIESRRTDIANFFKLVDFAFMGWIGRRNNQYAPAAPYYAFQMFTRHFGRVLVASKTSSPVYNSKAIGYLPAVQNVPYLDAIASVSEDGNKLYLIAINKNFDHAIDADISISDFKPANQGIATSLTGTGLDANTGTAPIEVPGLDWGRQIEIGPEKRFYKGAPGEIKMESSPFSGCSENFHYVFPPRSVTALELQKES